MYKRQLGHWYSRDAKRVYYLNREHLAYLIDYLSADLREKPLGRAKKTQSDYDKALPKKI